MDNRKGDLTEERKQINHQSSKALGTEDKCQRRLQDFLSVSQEGENQNYGPFKSFHAKDSADQEQHKHLEESHQDGS